MTWRSALPLAAFLVLAVALYVGLSLDPRALPSVLIDKPLPSFDLAPLKADAQRLNSANFADGQVRVLNVFASWCAPCRTEMPVLAKLAGMGEAAVIGLVYKDKSQATEAFLKTYGDPFHALGLDPDGRLGIELGVYGVPETFIIDGRGVIAFKHVGPILPADLDREILPAIKAAKARS